MGAVRGELNDRRRAVVNLAFNSLDQTGSGTLTLQDLANKYNVDLSPKVMSDELTRSLPFWCRRGMREAGRAAISAVYWSWM